MRSVRRSRTGSEHAPWSGEEGFTLLSVLMVTAVVSAAALAGAIFVRAGEAGTHAEVQAIQARALAQAGLVRVTAALEDGDSLAEELLASRISVAWQIGSETVELSLSRVAGKIDLNRGRGDLVAAVLQGVAPEPQTARRLLERLDRMRRSGEELEHVAALLDPAERFDSASAIWSEVFTVSTAAEGIELSAASPQTLRALLRALGEDGADADVVSAVPALRSRLAALLSGERPLYGVEIAVSAAEVPQIKALLARNSSTGRVTTFNGSGR